MEEKIISLLEQIAAGLDTLNANLSTKANESDDHMLTPKEAAKYINIGYDTLLSWARQGIIPSTKPGGHRVLFNKKSLDEWKTSQESQRNPKTKTKEGQTGKLRKIIA